jgi:hypothetical protein
MDKSFGRGLYPIYLKLRGSLQTATPRGSCVPALRINARQVNGTCLTCQALGPGWRMIPSTGPNFLEAPSHPDIFSNGGDRLQEFVE